jgi:dienelactone hydrolase
MWPILGQTTLDALRVLDWAAASLDTGPSVVAGGVSMGGDIAVAQAGIDNRVGRVAAIVANPDWTRPGMRQLYDPDTVLPQPPADSYAQWFYDRLDPLSHLDQYARAPAIAFHCGADDTHVPPEGALRFQEAWRQAYPRDADEIQVKLHAGRGHLDAARDQEIIDQSVAWLAS